MCEIGSAREAIARFAGLHIAHNWEYFA